MSSYTASIPSYLVDANDAVQGLVGPDGREWAFPAALTLAAADGASFLGFVEILFDATNTPVGYLAYGREFLFSSAFTLNTVRGYRQRARPTLLASGGQPIGVRSGAQSWLFPNPPAEALAGIPLNITTSVPMVGNVMTGVAPLLVFFNSLPLPDATTFTTLATVKFAWNFGDPGSGVWAPIGTTTALPVVNASRNTRYAPSAGHVYETPGTYVWTLTVTNPNGVTQVRTGTVVVQDPNVVFAGTQTICLANGTDFTGAPVGCIQVPSTSTINDAAVVTFLANNTAGSIRILYKCGDTFTASSTGNIIPLQARAQVRIGSWGSGAQPILKNTTTTVSFSSIISSGFSAASNSTTTGYDVAVNNLNLQGDPANNTSRGLQNFDSATTAYDATTGAILETKGRFLALNCTFSAIANPLYLCGTGSGGVNCSIENIIGAAGTAGIAVGFNYGASNFFLAGCYVDRCNNGEHGARLQGLYQADLYSNYFKRAAANKHLMTIREFQSPTQGVVPTQYVFRSNNYLDGAGGTNMSSYCQWAPTNTSVYGLIQYCIDDHNYDAHWDWASATASYSMPNRIVNAQYMVFRHNVMEMSCPSNGGIAACLAFNIQNGAATTPVTLPSNNILIDHTSIYVGTTLRASTLGLSTQVHDLLMRNTLIYAPQVTRDVNNANINSMGQVANTGGANCLPPDNVAANLLATFNSTNAQGKNIDPQWVTAVPVQPTDFVLAAGTGSYALTGGSDGGRMGANLQDLTAI